jgi:hypothetical protein
LSGDETAHRHRVEEFEDACRICFPPCFSHAWLPRGTPGGFFQNAKTFGQAGDDLPYQLGFIHFEISSLILEYNSFKHLRKTPYRPRLGIAAVVTTHVTIGQGPGAHIFRWAYGGVVRSRRSSTGWPMVK